jgi:hypothetical protein
MNAWGKDHLRNIGVPYLLKKALQERDEKEIDTESLLKMMDTVLDNNNFSFNNKHYIQTEGTDIGSKLERNYTCVYMGGGDGKKTFLSNPKIYHFSMCNNYIDHIFGVWTEGELKQFHQTTNKMHPNIQVDLRLSNSKIDFLDVTISIIDGILSTDLFCKPTDKNMYLNRTFSHPGSTKKINSFRTCTPCMQNMFHRGKLPNSA